MESESLKGVKPSHGPSPRLRERKKLRTLLFVTSVSVLCLPVLAHCLFLYLFSLHLSLTSVFWPCLCPLLLSISLFDPVWLLTSRFFNANLSHLIFLSISHCACVSLPHFTSLTSLLCLLRVSCSSSHSPAGCLLVFLHPHLAASHGLLLGPNLGPLPYQLPVGGSGPQSGGSFVGNLGVHRFSAVHPYPRMVQKVKLEGQCLSWEFCASPTGRAENIYIQTTHSHSHTTTLTHTQLGGSTDKLPRPPIKERLVTPLLGVSSVEVDTLQLSAL